MALIFSPSFKKICNKDLSLKFRNFCSLVFFNLLNSASSIFVPITFMYLASVDDGIYIHIT